jgi:hypothetical protein
MSERERLQGQGAPDASGADPREDRLRALCAAAYEQVQPSEALRRRVAGITAQPDVMTARRWPGWPLRRTDRNGHSRRPCGSQRAQAPLLRRGGFRRPRTGLLGWGTLTAVLLLAFLGLALVQLGPKESSLRPAPRMAGAADGEQEMPTPETRRSKPRATKVQSRPAPTEPLVPKGGLRASVAREFIRRVPEAAEGVDDLGHTIRDPKETIRDWLPERRDAWEEIEAHVRGVVPVRDDFVTIPFPRIASTSDGQIAAAVAIYKREAAIVDTRLAREVTLAVKATALSDLCDRLRDDTGVHLLAGSSVADEKVTLFCREMPLRDVMRQLSRPFGHTWVRSGKVGAFRYELMQDLRSQLLEEELRNRDRNAALLAMEREIQRYRPYLILSPDEALARAKTAGPEEKKLLETLADHAWGPIQLYFRLSARDMAALRAGERLTFRTMPRSAGEQLLPPDVARGVLQPFRGWNVVRHGDGYRQAFEVPGGGALPVPALSEARTAVTLSIRQSEPGRTALFGHASWSVPGAGGGVGREPAVGVSPGVARPDNAALNAAVRRDPALRARVTVRPQPGCLLPPNPSDAPGASPEPRVTMADVLEALHQATGLPVVADYYSRLYPPAEVSAANQPLFDALCRLADRMRLRWRWDSPQGWLQLRSASYYDDRLKEVPNRLLERWAAARRRHGTLTLDHLVEIAQLSDDQLNADGMAEAARACFGLREWEIARSRQLRAHLRFLAGFTPAQRQEAMGPAGLLFSRMPLAQQQRYLALALGADGEGLRSLEELAGATLRVQYTHPGGFQWGDPGHPGVGRYTRWVIPLEPGPEGRRVLRSAVQERTREAALQAVRRIEPRLREALLEAERRVDPQLEPSPRVVEEAQIFPTRLELAIVYIPGASNARKLQVETSYASYDVSAP